MDLKTNILLETKEFLTLIVPFQKWTIQEDTT